MGETNWRDVCRSEIELSLWVNLVVVVVVVVGLCGRIVVFGVKV